MAVNGSDDEFSKGSWTLDLCNPGEEVCVVHLQHNGIHEQIVIQNPCCSIVRLYHMVLLFVLLIIIP